MSEPPNPPVAVPGPASEPICPGPHGNGCDCKHNGADPHCPWVPGPASVSPAEPPAAASTAEDFARDTLTPEKQREMEASIFRERGERDRQQIARLTEALEPLVTAGTRIILSSCDRQEDWDAFADALASARAVLADKEDAE